MEQLQLNDFLQYRFLSQPKYAPGGKRAAFVVANCMEEENCYESRLWLYEAGVLRQLTDLGQERSFLWEDETHLLFPAVRSQAEKKRQEKKDQFTSYYRLDVQGGEALPAFTLPFSVQSLKHAEGPVYLAIGQLDVAYPDYNQMSEEERSQVAKAYEDNQDYEVLDEIPFWSNGAGFTNKHRSALFLVNVETGAISRITEPTFQLETLELVGEYAYFAGEAYCAKPTMRSGLWKLNWKTGALQQLVQTLPIYTDQLIAVGSKLLLLGTRSERHGLNENSWIYEVDQETGALSVLREEDNGMYGSVGSDCRYGGGVSRQARGEDLYYITTRRGAAHLYRLLPDGRDQGVVTKEGSIDSFALCQETDQVLLVALYDNRLQELYGYDLTSGELRQISHFNDAPLSGKYVAAPQYLSVPSCGLDIDGWVLLPKDFDPAQQYPGILDIHGGPKTAYGPVFYHEMQVWANLGYFVFFCNPKGSDGRGNEFADIRGHYGETDYQNIMDFTDAVLSQYPQIDPKRIAVTGGSYGGFMTNWIIGHTDRFACAASQRSISNWLSFYGVSDIGFYFATDQGDANPFDNAEKLWAHSPLRFAKHVTTPTLFIHSAEDYRCPMPEGMQMYTALMDRGIPARLCYFRGENHELSRSGKPKHRIRRLQEMTDWFAKYTKT